LEYLDGLAPKPVATTATTGELRRRLGAPLPETGAASDDVINEFVRDVEGGNLGSAGGRSFGWAGDCLVMLRGSTGVAVPSPECPRRAQTGFGGPRGRAPAATNEPGSTEEGRQAANWKSRL